MKRAFSEYNEDAPAKIQKLQVMEEEEHPILTDLGQLGEENTDAFVEPYQYEDSIQISIENSEEQRDIDNFAIENLEELYHSDEAPSEANFPTFYDEEEAYVNLNLNETPSVVTEGNELENEENNAEEAITKLIDLSSTSDFSFFEQQNFAINEFDSILGQEISEGDAAEEGLITHSGGVLPPHADPNLLNTPSNDLDFFYEDSKPDPPSVFTYINNNTNNNNVPLNNTMNGQQQQHHPRNININISNNNNYQIRDDERLDLDEDDDDLEEMMQYSTYNDDDYSINNNNNNEEDEDDDDDEGSDTNSDDDDESDEDEEEEEEEEEEGSSGDETSPLSKPPRKPTLSYSSTPHHLHHPSTNAYLHLKTNLSYQYSTNPSLSYSPAASSPYAVHRNPANPSSLLHYPPRPLAPPISQMNLNSVNFDDDSISKLYVKQKTEMPTMETPKGLKIELLKHQKEALCWMTNQEKCKSKGGILADDMGCGKTVSMIACILSNSFEGKQKNLIVVPASCLLQWEKEILTKTDRVLIPSIYIHYGYQRASDIQTLEDQDLVLTTYGTLSSEFNPNNRSASPLLRTRWNRVVLDEAHYIKNKQTKVASACYSLETKYRWCLTGTPIQNRLDDLYSLIFFLKYMPYANIDYWKTWIQKATTTNLEGGFVRLRKLISKIVLRRQKKDKEIQKILNLPPKVVITEKSKFTEFENEFYSSLERSSVNEFSKLVKEGTVMSNYGNVLTLIHRLRQACNHPKLVSKHFEFKRSEEKEKGMEVCGICSDVMEEAVISACSHFFCRACIRDYLYRSSSCPQCRAPIVYKDLTPLPNYGEEKSDPIDAFPSSSTKLSMLISKINEMRRENSRNKCVVISQWTSFLNIIRDSLDEKGIRWTRIDGMMSVKKRQSSIEEFSTDNGPSVMLLSLRAAGVGLNLAMANHVFMMDLWWNPAVEYQAIDRVHRLGQKNNVKVVKFTIQNTIEERILKLQEKKQAFVDGALGSVDVINHGKLTVTDLLDLFGLNERLSITGNSS